MEEIKITKSYTRRTPSVDAYLKSICKQPMVGPEEEVELAERIHKGDQRALDRLVRANLRFAFSIAKQYQSRGLELMDLIDEANLGLILAAQRFDETRGFKFISYAVWWIRQQLLLAISEQGNAIRRPLNQVSAISKINKAIAEFEQKNERPPSPGELAEITDIPEEKVLIAMTGMQHVKSTDEPFGDDGEGTILDVVPSDNMPGTDSVVMQESLAKEMDLALGQLSHREKEIICMFYGIGGKEHTLDEIGERYNLSRERVRQIKEKTIRRMQSCRNINALRTYLS